MSNDDLHDEAWMHDPEVISLLAEIDSIYEGVDQ